MWYVAHKLTQRTAPYKQHPRGWWLSIDADAVLEQARTLADARCKIRSNMFPIPKPQTAAARRFLVYSYTCSPSLPVLSLA
jgi:hypothetical protein